MLYGKKCFHQSELAKERRGNIDQWIQLLQESEDKESRQRKLHQLLRDYQLASGFPITAYLEDLLELYPNAKFVLTVRDAEKWLAVIRSTLLPKHRNPPMFTCARGLLVADKLQQLYQLTLRRVLGQSINMKDDNHLLNGYVQWIEHVERVVPSDRLLVYNIKSGWEPVCTFLQLPVPDRPFACFKRRSSSVTCNRTRASKLLHLFVCCLVYTAVIFVILRLIC